MDKEKVRLRHSIAQAAYDAAHCVGVYLKLNVDTDADVLEWLDNQPTRQGAIKRLIRQQIAAERWESSI